MSNTLQLALHLMQKELHYIYFTVFKYLWNIILKLFSKEDSPSSFPETRRYKRPLKVRKFEKSEIERITEEFEKPISRKEETRRLQHKATRKLYKPELMETNIINTVTGDSNVYKPKREENDNEIVHTPPSQDGKDVGHISFKSNTRRITRTFKRIKEGDTIRRKDPVTKRVENVKFEERQTRYYSKDGKLLD